MKTFTKAALLLTAFAVLGATQASAEGKRIYHSDGYKVKAQATVKNSPVYKWNHGKKVLKKKLVKKHIVRGQTGVRIGGSVANATAVKDNANIALGYKSRAIQSIGSIHGTGDLRIGGSVANATAVDRNINMSVGAGSTACQSIGSIGDNPAC